MRCGVETVHTIVVGRDAMACRFEVVFNLVDNDIATIVGAAALDVIEHVEEQISVYRPSSEISAMNASSAKNLDRVVARLVQITFTCETDSLRDKQSF